MSAHEDILNYVVTTVQGLTLPGIDPANVKKRALPLAREVLDAIPAVLVCPAGPETSTPHDFEGNHDVAYPVQVVVIGAANADLSVPANVLTAREAIRTHFANEVGVPSLQVYDSEVRPDPPLDRRRLAQNYHYSPLTVVFQRHED